MWRSQRWIGSAPVGLGVKRADCGQKRAETARGGQVVGLHKSGKTYFYCVTVGQLFCDSQLLILPLGIPHMPVRHAPHKVFPKTVKTVHVPHSHGHIFSCTIRFAPRRCPGTGMAAPTKQLIKKVLIANRRYRENMGDSLDDLENPVVRPTGRCGWTRVKEVAFCLPTSINCNRLQ